VTPILVIEPGQAAPSLSTQARGGMPVVAAPVCVNRGRLGEGQHRLASHSADLCQAWQRSRDNGQESPLVAGHYSATATVPSDVALG